MATTKRTTEFRHSLCCDCCQEKSRECHNPHLRDDFDNHSKCCLCCHGTAKIKGCSCPNVVIPFSANPLALPKVLSCLHHIFHSLCRRRTWSDTLLTYLHLKWSIIKENTPKVILDCPSHDARPISRALMQLLRFKAHIMMWGEIRIL